MYKCVNDKGKLIRNNNQFLCQVCNSRFDIYNDIPLFAQSINAVTLNQKKIYEQTSTTLTSIELLVYPTLLTFFTRKKYMDKLIVSDNMHILDIGTQDGVHLRYIKYKYPKMKDENMYGIDIAMSGLLVGKQHDRKINYSQSNIYSLPFDDAFFDIVIINGVLEHVDKPSDALKEISRVLKKDGQFTSFMPVKDYGLSFHWITNDLLKIRHMIYESTDAIGHDYHTVIKPLSEYRTCFVRNKLHVIKEDRTTILLRPLIDYLIVQSIPKVSRLKQYIHSKWSNSSQVNVKQGSDVQYVGYNEFPNKVNKITVAVHFIVKVLYTLTGLEGMLLSRFGGINYINYGVKSAVGNDDTSV